MRRLTEYDPKEDIYISKKEDVSKTGTTSRSPHRLAV